MAVDPNVYALSIQLSLESADAFSDLEKFGEAASNIEKSISDAAQNSINSLSGLVDNLSQQLSQMVVVTGQFSSASDKVSDSLSKSATSLKDAYSTEQDSFDNLEKRLVNLEKIKDIQLDIEKSITDEHKIGDEYLSTINKWVSALQHKNVVHGEEAGMVKAEKGLLSSLNDETDSFVDNLNDSDKLLRKIRASTTAIWAILKSFDEETEKFVTANYRVYGSQQQLLNNTRQLSVEYGVFRKEAIETYKALADVKTPRYEIYELSGAVGRANRVTGVGIEQIAGYTRELRGAGFSAARTRKQIDMLSAAQRAFGLSTYDMQKAIESNNLSMEEQVAYFGKDAPESFMKANLGLRGVAKELGVNQKAAEDWIKTLQLTGVEGAIVWEGFAGVSADASIKEKFEAMGAASRNFVDELGITQQQLLGLDKLSNDQQEALSGLTQEFKITTDQLFLMARAEKELTSEQKKQLLTMAGIEQAFKDQLDADRRWNESMHTLTAQLILLKDAFMSVIGFFVQLAVDALIPFLIALNSVIWAIGTFIGYVRSAISLMEEWIPGFKILMSVAKLVAGIFIGLGALILFVGGSILTFASIFSGVSGIIKGGLGIIGSIGKVFVSISKAIGQSIKAILTGLGQGLAALGKAVQPVIIPLLQLSVAVLLIGAGFWLMGMGMAAAAEHGWAAVGMLAAMVIASTVMITVLAIVATVAAPVIPLIIGLAFAVLMLGAAAMLAGLGMYFIGSAVEQFALYGIQAAIALPALASGIILLAAAGLVGLVGILALSVALWALVVPIMILGPTMNMLATAINMINSDNIIPVAQALMQSSVYFLVAGFTLAIAGPLLTSGSILILSASIALTIAAPFLFVASGLMVTSSAIMFTAGLGLMAAGVMFLIAGTSLLPASIMLAISSVAMVISAPLLIAAGIAMVPAAMSLMLGGIFLLAAAAILVPASIMVFMAGSAIGIGGSMMSVGLMSVISAVGLMSTVAKNMAFAVITFTVAMVAVYSAALLTQVIGGLLGPAGQLIDSAMGLLLLASEKAYNAGIKFINGAKYISSGAAMLINATGAIMTVAPSLLFSSLVLISSATMLLFASGIMMAGASMFFIASSLAVATADLLSLGSIGILSAAGILLSADKVLFIASVNLSKTSALFLASIGLLFTASSMLFVASSWLIPAAIGIYVGMSWIESATRRFRASASDIERAGEGLYAFSQAFDSLSKTPIDSLGLAVDAALDAIPGVDRLADKLDGLSTRFTQISDKLTPPIDRITTSLAGLSNALVEIGTKGINVQTDMDKVGAMLDEYATLLEGAAQRIEVAVATKARPAMASAREEGLSDAVRSEAITTVKVINESEGGAERVDEQLTLLASIAASLSDINDKMNSVGGNKGPELSNLIELLEAFLPEMTANSEGLTSEFNQWMK